MLSIRIKLNDILISLATLTEISFVVLTRRDSSQGILEAKLGKNEHDIVFNI